jgi:hypothetical protein
LERVARTGDLSAVLEPGALAEARGLADALGNDDFDLEAKYVGGWFHFYRCLALAESRDGEDRATAIEMLTLCFMAGLEPLPSLLLPDLAEQAVSPAIAVLQEALESDDRDLISATAELWQRIVDATPTGHPDRGRRMHYLGIALRTRFGRVGVLADLDAGIRAVEEAIQTTAADQPEYATMLSDLGMALRARFERTGAESDLDAAIEANQEAVQATPAEDPDGRGA